MTNSTTSLELVLETDSLPSPEIWYGSNEQKSFPQRLASSSRHTLLLDYDGTLAPFQADKMKAAPYPGVANILQELKTVCHTRIVLVTGRRVTDLESLIDIAKDIEIWGSHGREHIDANHKYTFFPPTAEQRATLDGLEQTIEAALQGVTLHADTAGPHRPATQADAPGPLEKKPASLAIHWRGLTADSQKSLQAIVNQAFESHGNVSIEQLPFEAGVEFRATGYTKAFAVNRVLETATDDDLIAYLGDDLTDEDAFAALSARGMSFLVRPTARASHARYWLRPPEELLRFLATWKV